MSEVTVVGAGVIGLTCALRLREAGHGVHVLTEDHPLGTTSAVAAAVWFPYRAEPRDRVLAWGGRCLEVLRDLAEVPGSGVRTTLGIFLSREPVVEPWWAQPCGGLLPCPEDERREEYPHSAAFEVPIVEMPTYLPWLARRARDLGVSIERTRVDDLAAVRGDVVVNATGLGARELVDDRDLVPVRGQVVRVANPGLDRFLLDEDHPEGPTYVIPRTADCVLGGTADEGAWDLEPDREVAASILRRCVEIEPRLRGAEVLGHAVGLRPARSTVRLERDDSSQRPVVHCYGHGGAGITLSWGCAEEVTRLVDAAAG